MTLPHVYCINLRSSSGRRARSVRRFRHHRLGVTIVTAIPRTSPLVEYYAYGVTPADNRSKQLGEIACYASHLKAIRQFLHDGGDEAFICEDDVLLHNDFAARWADVVANRPPGTPLVTLTYMMTQWETMEWRGVTPHRHNLISVDPIHTWGAQMYWITRDYALQVLLDRDRPFSRVTGSEITSESIIRSSSGLMVYPPLVIEDGIDSDREPDDLPFHHPHFHHWGYSNYTATEDADVSTTPGNSSAET